MPITKELCGFVMQSFVYWKTRQQHSHWIKVRSSTLTLHPYIQQNIGYYCFGVTCHIGVFGDTNTFRLKRKNGKTTKCLKEKKVTSTWMEKLGRKMNTPTKRLETKNVMLAQMQKQTKESDRSWSHVEILWQHRRYSR